MTIAIALAVIAVVAVAGVWLLRKQAAEQREGAKPQVEDGPPASAEEGASARPASDFPWQDRPEDRAGDDGLPPTPDLPPSASPEAVPAGPFATARDHEPGA